MSEIADDNVHSAEARKREGDSYRLLNRWRDAEKKWLAALELDPNTPGASLSLCDLYFVQGRHKDVRRLAERFVLLSSDPSNASALCLEAIRQEHERPAASTCLQLLESVMIRDPGDVEATRVVGRSCVELGRLAEGFEYLATATRLDPANPRAWSARLSSMMDVGRATESAKLGDALPQELKKDPAVLRALAYAHETIGDPDAEQLLVQLLELDPSDRKAAGLLAKLLRSKNPKASQTWVAKSLAIDNARERQARAYQVALREFNQSNVLSFSACSELANASHEMGWTEICGHGPQVLAKLQNAAKARRT